MNREIRHGGHAAAAVPELPELFISADATAIRSQKRFLRGTAVQLGLLVLAALAGMMFAEVAGGGVAAGQIVATAAFLAGAVLKAHMATTKPDHIWYQARAAAESARTLAWRYATGGQPFPVSRDVHEVDELLLDRLRGVLVPLSSIPVIPGTPHLEQITEWMRTTRGLSLDGRKATYRASRIQDEERWYASRAVHNGKHADRWGLVMVVFEVVGAVGALLASTGVLGVSLAGTAATIVGVSTAWLQTKQHQTLASAYAVASRELSNIDALITGPMEEDDWARFVDNAEGAISREHTLWASSRSR